jgi:hypothetical protein
LKSAAVTLAGAAVLAAYSVATLPFSSGWRWPRTPFDASASGTAVASGYALLRNAADRIPEGASVVVLTEPRDPMREGYFHRFAVALIPHARVLPAAFYDRPADPSVFHDSQYVVIVGPHPEPAPGDLLLDTPDGSVWRRHS